jgi:hypothetical protein
MCWLPGFVSAQIRKLGVSDHVVAYAVMLPWHDVDDNTQDF